MPPIATRLRTVWAGEAIDQAVPLPQYPRPMLQRDEWLNLNGTWDFVIVKSAGAPLDEPLPSEYEGQIRVPFALETVASGVTRSLGPDQTLFYRRLVELPQAWRSRRVALNFEAVDHEAVVWVDGQQAGSHLGGYLPFSVELPAGGGRHEVVVAVRDPGPAGRQQYGKQSDEPGGIWYTATSGIWQSVWAEPLPINAITAVQALTPATRDGFEVRVQTEATGQVEIVIELPDGSTVSARGASGQPIHVRVPEPRLWTPSDPHLYRLRVRCGDDEAHSWAGLRTIEIGPIPGASADERPAVLLNGRPVLLNTPLDQGYWPETGMTAPCDQALMFDLQQLRNLGFNGVRKHIKVESRRFYHHADRLGMLVIQDVVNGGRPRVGMRGSRFTVATDLHRGDTSRRALARAGRSSLTNREQFEVDLAAMIELLKPHPSVVAWVIFNEAWGQYQTNRIEAIVRDLDPHRLVDAASGWFDQGGGDFRSRHRYQLKLRRPPRKDRRPFFLSEFGGYSLAVRGHLWERAGAFGYRSYVNSSDLDSALSSLYREQLIPLIAHGLRGCVYTQVSDVEVETNGLFTHDRRVLKPDANLLRVLNAELLEAFDALGAGVD